MKKLLATAAVAAALATPGVAHASSVFTLECGQIRVTPPERHDRDPTIKIKFSMIWMPANPRYPSEFEVEHYSAAGQIYRRTEQYRSLRTWSTRDSDNWSGVSIRNPARTMVGTAYTKRGQTFYDEQTFKDGRRETTINSTCRVADEESY